MTALFLIFCVYYYILGAILAVLAAFAGLIVRVVKNAFNKAVDLQQENDLTVWEDKMPIIINLDVMLARRKMSSGELAARVGITPANISVLKTGKARAIRFSTLKEVCRVLNCQPGDILEFRETE